MLDIFLNQFSHCPFCSSSLKYRAEQFDFNSQDAHTFSISTTTNNLHIEVLSNYFIADEYKQNLFNFSIDLHPTNISHSPSTNTFLSLYPLSFILYKECTICTVQNTSPASSFQQVIEIAFDHSQNQFTPRYFIESLSFTYNSTNYSISNDHTENKSFITTQRLNYYSSSPLISSQMLPFHSLNFASYSDIVKKIDIIKLIK